jgi:hypothetical protein
LRGWRGSRRRRGGCTLARTALRQELRPGLTAGRSTCLGLLPFARAGSHDAFRVRRIETRNGQSKGDRRRSQPRNERIAHFSPHPSPRQGPSDSLPRAEPVRQAYLPCLLVFRLSRQPAGIIRLCRSRTRGLLDTSTRNSLGFTFGCAAWSGAQILFWPCRDLFKVLRRVHWPVGIA